MNPSPYGAPLPSMQHQPYGVGAPIRPPGPPGTQSFAPVQAPRYQAPPSNSFNGVDPGSPAGYGPPKPGPPLQNGPPPSINQNGSYIRSPYPGNDVNPPKSLTGPPHPTPQMMSPRGPPIVGEQLTQQMSGMAISPQQSGPMGPGPTGMPMRPPAQNLYGPPPPGSQFSNSPSSNMAPRPNLTSQPSPASQFPQCPPMPNQPLQNTMPPQNQYMPQGVPPMPPQSTPTPPLSSVNIGGPAQGGHAYHPQSGSQLSQTQGPSANQGQMNGPMNSAPYGQYPSNIQNRYPTGAPPTPNKYEQYGQMPPQPPGGPQTGFQGGAQPVFQGGAPGMPQPARMAAPLQQPQQARRLDPDQMPSPIQVIEDDRKNRGGDFYTNTKGQVPPLVTTNFVVHDEGICNPRFMRSTIYNVPCAPDMLKQTSVPFAVSVCPFAKLAEGEMAPPISNLGETGPVRCNRCKAYMCAFMQFIDGGRRFQCVYCKGTTEVPPEYFAHLDHTGQRVDKFQRPELCLGAFEFIATKEYCRNGEFPKPPAFIFMIEVSFTTIKNGLVNLLSQNLKRVLANLPKDVGQDKSAVRVGFVTYNSVIHFYDVKGNLGQPKMMVVPDVTEMFVPLIDGFLVTLDESEAVIDSLLEQIPITFADTRETEVVLGPVITAGLEALKAADCSGKLLIFHSSLPNAEAPGKLKNRDDRKLLGSDKEKTILNPQNQFYNNLGQECVTASCCVDLFLFPNAYVDVATLSQVCKLTGGQLYKYAYFQADIDGERFLEDLRRDVEKQIAFETVLRVRTSTGIRPTDFYGNYYMANTTDVELAAIDCDKALSVEIKYDDKLTEEDGAYVQTAVLYTSCGGQRRLRILNLALNTCNQMADLYRNCELDVVVNYLAKMGLRQLLEHNPRQLKDLLVTKAAQILATYRKNCASPSSVGQLILPECMKLLPLYVNCLLKNDALFGGSDMAVDDRSYAISLLNSMDIYNTVGYFYPRLIAIHDLDPEGDTVPNPLRCSVEKVRENGAYILENGLYLFIWLGHALCSEWLQDVFAVSSTAVINSEKPVLLELNTPMSTRVRGIVDKIKNERNRSMKLVILKQGDRVELVFRQFLVEDRTSDGSVSYVDFLCHLHKEIRNLLT